MSFNASDIIFFFGAGASAPFGIPTMKQFVVDFEKFLNENGSESEKMTYTAIKQTLEKKLQRQVDLEAVFTVIDGIINYSPERLGLLSLYSARKIRHPTLMDKAICRSLKQKFHSFVREKCLISSESFDKISKVYRDFFNRLWMESTSRSSDIFRSQGNYRYCTKWTMFTTNYDPCLEHYWRQVARVNLNTGFSVQEARRAWLLDPSKFSQTGLRLFKLHGSISWQIEPDGTVAEEQTIMGRHLLGRKFVGEMMIYPIQQKELYVEPYISMLKELNQELKTKSIWIIIGYSFNDPVIQEIFIRNSDERKRIVLIHPEAQKIKEERLANIKCKEMFLLNKKFGEEDFMSVNYSLIKQFKINPSHPSSDTV